MLLNRRCAGLAFSSSFCLQLILTRYAAQANKTTYVFGDMLTIYHTMIRLIYLMGDTFIMRRHESGRCLRCRIFSREGHTPLTCQSLSLRDASEDDWRWQTTCTPAVADCLLSMPFPSPPAQYSPHNNASSRKSRATTSFFKPLVTATQ